MNDEHYTPTFWELPQKKCNKCGRLKALDHFSPDRRIVADGLQGICKSCRLEDQKKRYTPKRKKLAPDGSQKCTVCGEVKVLDKFPKDKRRPLGRESRCKKCRNAYGKKYRVKNSVRIAKYNRSYREEHREEHRAYNRRYKKENPDVVRQQTQRRRARKLGVATGPKPTKEERLAMQGWMCALCKKKGKNVKWEYDHIMPLCRGGSDTVDNMEIICSECNRAKAGKHPLNFAFEQGRLV